MGVWGKNLGPLVLPPGIGERRSHPAAVVREGTNERMLVQKRQRLLLGAAALHKLS